MTEPIRKSILPTTPPPEWEFATVLGAPHGCALLPTDTGDVVVRRRVTYGDWEPVRPDHWADEPATVGGAARTASGQQPETTPCGHCKGSGADPEDEGDYVPEVHRHNPFSVGPCPECNGDGTAVGQPAEAQATGQHRPPCVNGNRCGEPGHCPPSPAYERLQAAATKTNREMAGATLRAYKRIYQLAHNATGPIQPSDILDALKDPEPDPAKLLAAITAEAQPVDRAAVLDEAADAVERENTDCLVTIVGRPCQPCATRAAVAAHLRRMAEEARS